MNQSKQRRHPHPDRLTEFGLGRLSGPERRAIEKHVAMCERCCQLLGQVGDDSLVELARAAAGTSFIEADETNFGEVRPEAGQTKNERDRRGQTAPAELSDHPRYRIVERLGAGGMGVVYKAEHRMMERAVALKVIRPELVSHPTAIDRFHQEVKAAAQLVHPNIVTAFDAERAGDVHFLVMEFVDGISLDQLAKQCGRLSVAQSCNFVRQAAQGLQHAFEKGMVHRDIKPQNLMATRDGDVKIMDFGLARFASERGLDQFDESRDGITAANVVLGTPDYMAPEQAIDARSADVRADIYSLGCTLYYLLSGRVPFPEGSSTQKLAAHMVEVPKPLLDVEPSLPEPLVGIVEKMMAKEPSKRFQSPSDVAEALLGFTGAMVGTTPAAPQAARPTTETGLPNRQRVTAVPNPATAAATSATDSSSPLSHLPPEIVVSDFSISSQRRPRDRSMTWIAIGAAGLLAIVVLGSIWVNSNDKTPPNQPDETAKPRSGAENAKRDLNPSSASDVAPKIASHKAARVLFVLPHASLWYDDYGPVRDILEAAGVKVIVAAASEWIAPEPGSGSDERFQADLLLGQVKSDDFDAVIFVGGSVSDLTENSVWRSQLRQLIREMLDNNRHVAAICLGQLILADLGTLRNRSVAFNQIVDDAMPENGIDWMRDKKVVVDGQLITASDPDDAVPFAAALLKALGAE